MGTDGYHPAQGLTHFDGERWTRVLEGRLIEQMSIAPDGNAWIIAGAPGEAEAHLYVITPEALAGTE